MTSTPPLGGTPFSVAVVGGKVWTSLPGQQELLVVDPANPAGAPATVSVPGNHCGPVGIVDGGNGYAYVSLPANAGPCTGGAAGEVAVVSIACGATTGFVTGVGDAFDLAVGNGQLFVPDYDGGVVRRFTLGAAPTRTATWTSPDAGAAPDGIAVSSGGDVVTTFNATGGAGTRGATAGDGALTSIATTPAQAFGVGFSGTDLYLAGKGGVLVRRADGTSQAIPVPAGAEPWDLGVGPDGAKGAGVTGTVNPGGESTTTKVEYGTTTAYGASAAGPTVGGLGDQPVTVALTGLEAGSTYHYRVVATNPRGTTTGADQSFTTRIGAKVKVAARVSGKTTVIGSITVSKLAGKEKVTVTCQGKGCPKKARKQSAKAGKKTTKLRVGTALNGVALRGGTTLVVTVTRAGAPAVRTTVVTRAGKKPTVTTQTVG